MTMYITPDEPILAPYITHNSSINPFDEDFKPYVKYDDEEQIYVPYNYDETMAQTPVKLGEIDLLSSVDWGSITTIIILDDTGREYRVSKDFFVDYVLSQTVKNMTIQSGDITTTDNPNDTLELGDFAANNAQIWEVSGGNQLSLRGENFTQSGTTIKLLNGASWVVGQVIRAKK